MGVLVALTLPGLVLALLELVRDDEADGAPPGSRVDLVAGTAHLRLPRDP
jgi:hypothetical protein